MGAPPATLSPYARMMLGDPISRLWRKSLKIPSVAAIATIAVTPIATPALLAAEVEGICVFAGQARP